MFENKTPDLSILPNPTPEALGFEQKAVLPQWCHLWWFFFCAILLLLPTHYPMLLMLAPSSLHVWLNPWRFREFGMMGADPVHMEKQPRNRQVQSHTLISLLPGRRKSSLLWRTPQPAAAELTYGSHLPYEEAPSHTCHHLAPLLWGTERSSLSGKTGRSLRFLTMPITKWTSSENNGAVVSSLVTCQPSHLEEGCLRSEPAPRPYRFGREL